MRDGRSADVVGAGIAGLTAGLLLARDGWRVRIHERGSAVREIGAGILLKHNSLTVLERTGVAPAALRRATRLEARQLHAHDGRLVQRRTLEGEFREVNVLREDLVLALADAAQQAGAEILTSSEVVEATPEGVLRTTTGREYSAELVVAADGAWSAVRDRLGLTGVARERVSGATRCLIERVASEAAPIQDEYWSGNRRLGVTPCTPELTYIYASSRQDDASAASLPLDVESWTRAFPTLRHVFERMHNADGITRFAYPYVHCDAWTSGRVAVIGDAAHALPPTLGQGAGLAVMNSAGLAVALRGARDVPAALAEWERRHRPLTDHTQRWSLRYDALASRWPARLGELRRPIMWAFGRSSKLNSVLRAADRTADVAIHVS